MNKRAIFNSIIPIMGIILFLVIGSKILYNIYHLSNFGKYTDGVITKIEFDYMHNKIVYYTYIIKSEKYFGYSRYDDKISPKIGEVYPVKYSYKNPTISTMKFRLKAAICK